MKKQRAYVGCALQGATDAFRQSIADFKKDLAQKLPLEVLEFIPPFTGTPTEVYMNDIANVRSCDLMIAIVDQPSLGLGMEMNEAITLKKPLLCLHQDGTSISRMLLGARDLGMASIETYNAPEDMVGIVERFLNTLAQKE